MDEAFILTKLAIGVPLAAATQSEEGTILRWLSVAAVISLVLLAVDIIWI